MFIVTMRKIKIVLLMFVIITDVYAQPRVDGGTNAKVVHSSPIVNNFVGWSFNSKSQKWIGYYNTISSWYSKNYKKPIKLSPGSMSYDDNIINLSFKTILFEDSIYYVLCAPYYYGYYRYPYIKEDWHYALSTKLYVFTKSEYDKLKELKLGINIISSIKSTSYSHEIGFGTYRDFSSAMNVLFKSHEDLQNETPHYFFYVKKEEDGVIRFQNITEKPLDESQDVVGSLARPNFNFHYYEINVKTFLMLTQ